MAKGIKQVKSKKLILETLTRKLRTYRKIKDAEHNLLKTFIDLDPIFEGREDKFNFDGTREKWIKFHAEFNHKTDTGHWTHGKKNIKGLYNFYMWTEIFILQQKQC